MNLIFFQNCVSPHQIPYIRECVNDERIKKVYFVSPRIDYGMRSDMGWSNDKLLNEQGTEFLLSPTDQQIQELLLNVGDANCLFSGIRADADVFRWLNLSLSYNVKRYIITEPPYIFDKPLWMHYIRFFIQDYKYVKHIDGIFAIGESCEKYYRSISKCWKVFPFIYVTESYEVSSVELSDELQILYVGSLSKRKNVKILLEALRGNKNVSLNIVGDGEERSMLEQMAQANEIRANFIGTLPMKEIPVIMQQNDVLVLPSLYDGWGAVVNEALTQGLYVVCSDRCGAKDLLHTDKRGCIFGNDNSVNLGNILKSLSDNVKEIRNGRSYRVDWARKNISGKSMAKYFIDCISEANTTCIWK